MSAKGTPIRVVLCWHMHQPHYLDPERGRYELPWTYLHAIKDYVDMAAHLEAVEGARAVVNFTPTLLEQIDHYARALDEFLDRGRPIPDPLLQSLAAGPPVCSEARMELVRACLRANEHRLIRRFGPYQQLVELAEWLHEHPAHATHVTEQFLVDLVVWYHLAWLGETVRREDGRIRALIERGRDFRSEDRHTLVTCIAELIGGVVGRYRSLAEAGRVELSVTPYAHPISPLLLDFRSAREAVPDLTLPPVAEYPGGQARLQWHIDEAMEVFERHFGFEPTGLWPAEGALCRGTLDLLAERKLRWTATGGQILHNSLGAERADGQAHCIHRPYQWDGTDLVCFFRDDGLSDLIGFSFADWHAEDAVANLIHHIENIAHSCREQPDAVVAIVLDGENAWEHYPANGYYFLDALYRRLAEHPQITLSTFSECADTRSRPTRLDRLVAGSWVYGTLTTWIGHPDKNRAWEMLVEAKQAFDQFMNRPTLDEDQKRRLDHQLAVCEGSDWFWWFGDDNPEVTVREFDYLFRMCLTRLYELLGRAPPDYLAQAFTHGGGSPKHGGVMRPGAYPVSN